LTDNTVPEQFFSPTRLQPRRGEELLWHRIIGQGV
jgi:hypothetical protein